ncbi:MAG: glycosyltransferase [Prevotellaceae bacterium]|jgi:glycosyltransferase involved in cell wall biosynthesis|nr:glycosyltransferase [Prevotellaceae bacterium]
MTATATSPYLSIIIPFYGTADRQWLQRCLDSIRQQGFDEVIETLVVDDGGKGPGGARNKGIRQATGDYLLFVDADDYLMPCCLERCLPWLKQHSPDMFSFGMVRVNESEQPQLPPSYITPMPVRCYPSGAAYMWRHNFFGTVWHHFFRREFITGNALLFAEERFHQDEDFLLKAYSLAGKTLVTDTPHYVYVKHALSITHSSTLAMRLRRLADFRAMLRRVSAHIRTLPPASLARRAACRRYLFLQADYVQQMVRNLCRL